MNTAFFRLVWGSLLALMMAADVIGQEPSAAEQKQQTRDEAAVTQGIRWLHARQGADLQYDKTLSVLLADKLVSSNDLGVDLVEIQPALRAQLNLAEGTGLVVTTVPDNSPGASAGLKAHDVLVNIGAIKVGSLAQVAEGLQKAQGESADKTVMLGVIRQGRTLTLKAVPKSPQIAEVILGDAPVALWSKVDVKTEPRYRVGVILSEADDTLRAQVGLAAGEGLIVTEVYPDTPAAKAGIQPHDVLVILDGKRLSTVDAVNAQIQEIKEREVELKLLRGGKEVTVKIAPQKEAADLAQYQDFARAWTIWNPGVCPGQARAQQCTSCHQNPFPEWKADADYHRQLGLWLARTKAAEAGSPQEQVNQLQEQLAKMQETLSTLEASLAAAEEKPANPPDAKE